MQIPELQEIVWYHQAQLPLHTLQIRGEVAHGPTRLIDVPVEFLSLKVHGVEPDDQAR